MIRICYNNNYYLIDNSLTHIYSGKVLTDDIQYII